MSRFSFSDILIDLGLWYKKCPPFTKGLFYFYYFASFIIIFVEILLSNLLNVHQQALRPLDIRRLFLSPFAFLSLLSTLFSFFVYFDMLAKLERQYGTVKTIVDYFWKNFFINVMLVIVVCVLGPRFLRLFQGDYNGLSPIFFAQLVIQCLENPEAKSSFLRLPGQIKAKYHPFILWLVIAILSGSLLINYLVAMLVGYIHHKVLNRAYHNYLNNERMGSWEGSFLFRWLKSFSNYSKASGEDVSDTTPESQPQTRGLGDTLVDLGVWYKNCPLFTKGLIYTCLFVAFINIFTKISDNYLVNVPEYVVRPLEIRRLFLSPFASRSFLSLLFSFFAYLGISTRIERQYGTVKTIVDFFWKNFFINVLLVIVAYLLGPRLWYSFRDTCEGLLPIFFAQLVIQCLENPEAKSSLLHLPGQIKAKYHPFILLLVISIFSGGLRISHLIAMLVGYIHHKVLNRAYHNYLNDERMASWEESFPFSWLKSFSSCSKVSIQNE